MTATVLIVDDNENNRFVLADALEDEGYTLREATDGVEALELVEQDPPDLVLLDIMMPGMDGIECCRWLKAGRHAHIPVILVSALSEQRDVVRGLNEGAADYVAKPFNGAIVRARVRAALRSKKAQDELKDRTHQVHRLVEELESKNRQLKQLALHDVLTGLPNRARLYDCLDQAIQRAERDAGYHFALLYLDFDGFKLVNDSLGHEAGDTLLVSIAGRIQEQLRGIDTVCCGNESMPSRLGGDEFVVLLDGLADPADATTVAARLQAALGRPHTIADQPVTATVSIGIVLSDPRYRKPEEMLRDADAAMYEAKKAGRACERLFDGRMHELALERMQLSQALREAVPEERISLHYHPVVGLDDGRCVGHEATCRWHHEEHGWIEPDRLARIAEEAGLTGAVGRLVVRQAAAQLAREPAGSASDQPRWISVSLRALPLHDTEFVGSVRDALQRFDVEPARLILEIPEALVVSHLERLRAALDALRDLGVRLAMATGGRGQSALTRLHRIPVDVLKIDRHLIGSLGLRFEYVAMVHAVISLAHNLNLRVVADGVETREQVAQLQALECDWGQGPFFQTPGAGEVATPHDAGARIRSA